MADRIIIYPGYLQYEWLWAAPFVLAVVIAIAVVAYRRRARRNEEIISEAIARKAGDT